MNIDISRTRDIIGVMNPIIVFKALSNETRLQILHWLKEPEKHFPSQEGGDSKKNRGLCRSYSRKGRIIAIDGFPISADASESRSVGSDTSRPMDILQKKRTGFSSVGRLYSGTIIDKIPIIHGWVSYRNSPCIYSVSISKNINI